jgi:hypothetical protein
MSLQWQRWRIPRKTGSSHYKHVHSVSAQDLRTQSRRNPVDRLHGRVIMVTIGPVDPYSCRARVVIPRAQGPLQGPVNPRVAFSTTPRSPDCGDVCGSIYDPYPPSWSSYRPVFVRRCENKNPFRAHLITGSSRVRSVLRTRLSNAIPSCERAEAEERTWPFSRGEGGFASGTMMTHRVRLLVEKMWSCLARACTYRRLWKRSAFITRNGIGSALCTAS